MLHWGNDVAIVCIGTSVGPALEAASILEMSDIKARVINARFVKPLDEAVLVEAAEECDAMVLLEENSMQAGFGSAVLECLALRGCLGKPIELVALPDEFVGHAKASELRAHYGLCAQGIVNAADKALAKTLRPERGDRIVLRPSI